MNCFTRELMGVKEEKKKKEVIEKFLTETEEKRNPEQFGEAGKQKIEEALKFFENKYLLRLVSHEECEQHGAHFLAPKTENGDNLYVFTINASCHQDIAYHPYLSFNWAYITVIKHDHSYTVSIVDKNGMTPVVFSFPTSLEINDKTNLLIHVINDIFSKIEPLLKKDFPEDR